MLGQNVCSLLNLNKTVFIKILNPLGRSADRLNEAIKTLSCQAFHCADRYGNSSKSV